MDEQTHQSEAEVLEALRRDDAYRVVDVLAEGASGRTEMVMREAEGPFVRKYYPVELCNPEVVAQLAQVDEPLLPRLEEWYQLPDRLVVVRDWVAGRTLAQRVADGPLDARDAVDVLGDVCRAVGALHERGIIHRDLTPGNVVCARDGAHVIDLGIARLYDGGEQHDTTTLGTWGFAAPEQFGFAQTDARSDIYSLGCLLAFMLTGVRPGEDAFDAQLEQAAPQGGEMRAVIDRARSFEPSARFASTSELAEVARKALPRTDVIATGADGKISSEELHFFFASPRVLWRAFRDAPLSFWKVLAVPLILADAFFAGLFAIGAVGSAFELTSMVWRVASLIICLGFLSAVLVRPVYEIVLVLLGAGPFAGRSLSGRIGGAFASTVFSVIFWLIIVAVAAGIAIFIAGPGPY